ncbi:MAG: hypothetical protein DMF90_29370 [Acidobacteria bacterium]|nr:MAG: hypothetical protein DMF90_29370 [Acidobacteriota bacterium]
MSDGPPVAATGANVTMTIDAVDTQERRQVGPFLARHVITTTTTEAEPGANARTGTSLRDGWYIDLPPADCWDWGADGPILSNFVVRAGSRPDRVHVARRGTARRGFPIEETSRSEDGSPASRITLIEISDKPLDDALFTVPAGYRPALPRLHGGFDMTKPDTLVTGRKYSHGSRASRRLPLNADRAAADRQSAAFRTGSPRTCDRASIAAASSGACRSAAVRAHRRRRRSGRLTSPSAMRVGADHRRVDGALTTPRIIRTATRRADRPARP